jgi:hypothetical protein
MFTIDAINKSSKFTQTYFSKLPQYLFTAFTFITILAIFVPLSPHMPSSGLDPSWQFAINKALVLHLDIGKEIIFTFGPYASIYTHNYYPETNHLMVSSSLFLGLCYAGTLLYLAKDKKHYVLLAIVLYLAGFTIRDTLFFVYPLILATCAAKFINSVDSNTPKKLNASQLILIAVAFAPLGLLPLVKGSFLLICSTVAVVMAAYFLYHRYLFLGLLTLISPIVSVLILWVISGQSLFVLPSFLVSLSPIISGYAEAMSEQGDNAEIVAYLLGAIAIVWSLVTESKFTLITRLFLSICFLLFLFIAFKAGFTRHDDDDHSNSAAAALVLIALIFSFLSIEIGGTATAISYPYFEKPVINKNVLLFFRDLWVKHKMTALVIPIIASAYINMPTRNIFNNFYYTYVSSWSGLYSRLTNSDHFRSEFEHSLEIIRKEYQIPMLQGTTDIYPFDQSYLLASNNNWNPRPIIQSYSVYTAQLAKINEQHIRGDNAPDNILFRVQTIDARFPSLDDGLSWPALLDNYTINKVDENFKFVYFRKKLTLQKNSRFDILHDKTHEIGENIIIPPTNTPVYAEIILKPTVLGKLLGLLFKQPQLAIALKLKNGTSEQYRVIANMMESGFFISPLIKDTKDFLLMGTGNLHYIDGNTVESFTLAPAYGGSLFWSANYQLKLKTYPISTTNNAIKIPFNDMVDFPEKYTEAKPTHCSINQSIDQVNGISTDQPKLTATSLLTINGWLAFSAKDGITADETFITLTDTQGSVKYLKTRHTSRPDVTAYFKQPAMPTDIGFTTTVDVTKLQGVYKLGLARTRAGKLEQCLETIIPITITQTTDHEPQ